MPEATLVVAGTGPDLRALQSLATELDIADRVDFCGRMDRDQMAELYRSAALVLNPSRVDNMPNSVLEAMASGVPVVSTNVGGVPFILRDGVTGLLVAAGDHEAMAVAAERVLLDPELAARLRRAALAEIAAIYMAAREAALECGIRNGIVELAGRGPDGMSVPANALPATPSRILRPPGVERAVPAAREVEAPRHRRRAQGAGTVAMVVSRMLCGRCSSRACKRCCDTRSSTFPTTARCTTACSLIRATSPT